VPPIVEAVNLSKTFRRCVRGSGLRGLLESYARPSVQTVEAVRGLNLELAESESLALIAALPSAYAAASSCVELAEGESLALIGPNGAGKSTTIKR